MNPLAYTWNGEAFVILPRFAKEADKRFTVGQVYRLEEIQDRSSATHRHYFASINEAWQNLPERMSEQFPTPEHLRKWCLIKAGYHNRRSIVTRSKTEALRLAGFIKPMDEYAIVTVTECVVDVFNAQSQSHKAMGKQEFAKSKDAVLGILADLISVPTETLERAGAEA